MEEATYKYPRLTSYYLADTSALSSSVHSAVKHYRGEQSKPHSYSSRGST
jgi:hypothetical protein